MRYELRTVKQVDYASMPGVSTFWFTQGDRGYAIRNGGRSDVQNFPPGTIALLVFSENSAWIAAIAKVTGLSEDGYPTGYEHITTNPTGGWVPPTKTDPILDLM